jgi:uncharacterized protein
MMKWLVLAVVVVAVLWLLGRSRRAGRDAGSKGAAGGPPPSAGAGRGPASTAPQPMVACAHCGVLLPEADALRPGAATAGAGPHTGPHTGPFYCSEAHRRAGPAGG